MKVFGLEVCFERETNGVVFASIPALPGCITEGGDINEAKEMIVEAAILWVASGLEDNGVHSGVEFD